MTTVREYLYTVIEINAETLQKALDTLAEHFRNHPDKSITSIHYENIQDEHGKTIEHFIGVTIA